MNSELTMLGPALTVAAPRKKHARNSQRAIRLESLCILRLLRPREMLDQPVIAEQYTPGPAGSCNATAVAHRLRCWEVEEPAALIDYNALQGDGG
jgi:hypothetical protein